MRTMPIMLAAMFSAGIAAQAVPAAAKTCGWSATMEQDEGGSVMMASVCGGAKQDANLSLTCAGQPTLSYDLGPSGPEVESGATGSFTFDADGRSVTKKLQLEEMYNEFTVYLTPSDPLLTLLQGKGDVTVSSPKYGKNSFPLTGSSKAIRKVLANCKEGGGADND